VAEFDSAAGFLTTQHGDEPFGDSVIPNHLSDEALLAKLSRTVQVGPSASRGNCLRVIDEPIGVFGNQGDEILPPDLKPIVNEGVEASIAAEGQVSFENNSIKASQSGYNASGELLDESVHGVLPLRVV
jgi:hypothetical protein